MKLSNENLTLSQIKHSEYRFSYEPSEGVSAEGIVSVDLDHSTEYSDRGEVMFTDTEILGIEFTKIQIWDAEGSQEITDTEEGLHFRNELLKLIKDELS